MGVRRASREAADQPWVDKAARIGVAVRGVVFLVLAYLVIRIASGALGGSSTKTAASGSGVAQAVANQSGGTVMVFLLGVGLAFFAMFCLLETVLHHEQGSDAKRWANKGQSAFRAVVYGALSGYAFYTAFRPRNRSGSTQHVDKNETQWSARVLSWPAGWLWLGLVGAVLVGAAVYLGAKAVRRSFFEDLETGRMSHRAKSLATVTGVAGHLARGALFAVVAWFVLQAAFQDDPSDSQGVDGSVRNFADNAAGAVFLYILAAGLIAFGSYLFVEARYRKV